MKVIVSTHQGVMYRDKVDYFVIKNQDGEFACQKNHLPIISIIKEGYVKLVRDNLSICIVLVNAVMEFMNNECNILAQEAQAGKTLEEAKSILETIRFERTQLNKKEQVDYTNLQKELNENIKKTKAGNL